MIDQVHPRAVVDEANVTILIDLAREDQPLDEVMHSQSRFRQYLLLIVPRHDYR